MCHFGSCDNPESTKKMEEILNFQVLAEGLELVILLHTQLVSDQNLVSAESIVRNMCGNYSRAETI